MGKRKSITTGVSSRYDNSKGGQGLAVPGVIV